MVVVVVHVHAHARRADDVAGSADGDDVGCLCSMFKQCSISMLLFKFKAFALRCSTSTTSSSCMFAYMYVALALANFASSRIYSFSLRKVTPKKLLSYFVKKRKCSTATATATLGKANFLLRQNICVRQLPT